MFALALSIGLPLVGGRERNFPKTDKTRFLRTDFMKLCNQGRREDPYNVFFWIYGRPDPSWVVGFICNPYYLTLSVLVKY